MALIACRHTEKEDLNQYWYSPATIQVLVKVQHCNMEAHEDSSIAAGSMLCQIAMNASALLLLQELTSVATRAAFLSTPSLYFSLPKVDGIEDSLQFCMASTMHWWQALYLLVCSQTC